MNVELVIIARPTATQGSYATYSTLRLLIEFADDGRLRLREDRQPGETATRCTDLDRPCVDPVILYRVGALPAPSPT